jgi:metallo-beta-lactamase family protein
VTGSKHLVQTRAKQVMVDCGLFQGSKEHRLRNWAGLPVDPTTIDDVILTHAHIDHTGYLPRSVVDGFEGRAYCTPATQDLARIMLPDSAHLQEEDARWANKKGFSKHKPALPLYTVPESLVALEYLSPIDYDWPPNDDAEVSFVYRDAGHILGSAIVEVWTKEPAKTTKIVFSGDLGRWDMPIIRDPTLIGEADYLVVESTYGDRLHPDEHPKEQLARVINDTVQRRGVLVVPSFAVGRTQELLYFIRELEIEKRIPVLPVFVDSPMACDATEIFLNHPEDHDVAASELREEGRRVLRTQNTRFSCTTAQSKEINKIKDPMIVISASGMCTGGRILHHLALRLPDKRNTILFVGFQAEETRGRALLNGTDKVKIHGRRVAVKAHIENIPGFSAHADYSEILRWLRGFVRPPKCTFIVHGEPQASAALSTRIREELGWETHIPEYLERVELD